MNISSTFTLEKNLLHRSPILLALLLSVCIINGCQSNKVKPVNHNTTQSSVSRPANKSNLALYDKALAELRNKKYKNAESILLKLSKERPDLAGPWANLALIKLIQNKLLEAESYLNTAFDRNPKMPQVFNLMGLLAVEKKEIQKAEQHYLSAIKFKDNYAKAHYNLALLYDIYLQDIEKAVKHYRRYSQLTKNQDKDLLNWLEQLENSLGGE